jgi:ATP-dependent helicase/nuclease subunit A
MTLSQQNVLPADQAARERFITGLDRNFSVIAPAGVGKTRAIVERVIHLADSTQGRAVLPTLAVVTYTNKAADEMQERARNALLDTPTGALLMGEFNRAFFGTIHSFCLTLLMTHGHYLGLPGKIELTEGDAEEAAWNHFFRNFEFTSLDTGLSARDTERCFRHLAV